VVPLEACAARVVNGQAAVSHRATVLTPRSLCIGSEVVSVFVVNLYWLNIRPWRCAVTCALTVPVIVLVPAPPL